MATRAFILVETAVGKTREVSSALRKLSGVQSVDVVTGPYDIIAVVETASINSVGDLVTGNIHNLNGVVKTVTCVAIGG